MVTSLKGLTLLLFTLTWLSWRAPAQETPRLTTQDSLDFSSNLQIVRDGSVNLKLALEQALQEKQIIEQVLFEAQKRYDDLVSSAMQHSADLTLSLEQALTVILALREQLKNSSDLVGDLRAQLHQQEIDEQAAIAKTVADNEVQVKQLESDVFWARLTAAVLAALAALFGGLYLFKPG
jgi:hypothetical protein